MRPIASVDPENEHDPGGASLLWWGKHHHHYRPPSGYNPKRRPDFSAVEDGRIAQQGNPSGADEPGGNFTEPYRDPTAG